MPRQSGIAPSRSSRRARGSAPGGWHTKKDVRKALLVHKLGVGMDNVHDALAREDLFTEAALDTHQNFPVRRVSLVENVLERKIRRSEAVAEILRKGPATVYDLVRKE